MVLDICSGAILIEKSSFATRLFIQENMKATCITPCMLKTFKLVVHVCKKKGFFICVCTITNMYYLK